MSLKELFEVAIWIDNIIWAPIVLGKLILMKYVVESYNN